MDLTINARKRRKDKKLKITDLLFNKKSRESEDLVKEMRAAESKIVKKPQKIEHIDGRKRSMIKNKTQRALEVKRAELRRELEKLNSPTVIEFQEECIQRMKELPSQSTVEELSNTKFRDGTTRYKIRINSAALSRCKSEILAAMAAIRGMKSSASLPEIQSEIEKYNKYFDAFDFSELEVIELSASEFADLKKGDKSERGKAATGYLTPTGDVKMLKSDDDLAPRLQDISDRLYKLEGKK
jgi:hypothetical protein